jgi:hypothetical protein
VEDLELYVDTLQNTVVHCLDDSWDRREDEAKEVFCMPVICRDKVRLGIARRDIGKRSSWIAMDAQLVRQRCDTCLSQKAAIRTPLSRLRVTRVLPSITPLLCFSCSSSLHRVNAPPAGTKLCRVASTEVHRLRRISPQNAEHGVVRNYVRTFFTHVSCLTLPSARMAHRSALDPTATWFVYPYEDRLPP